MTQIHIGDTFRKGDSTVTVVSVRAFCITFDDGSNCMPDALDDFVDEAL